MKITGEESSQIYRSTKSTYQRLGFISHDDMISAIIELSRNNSKSMKCDFNHGDENKSLLSQTKNSYDTFGCDIPLKIDDSDAKYERSISNSISDEGDRTSSRCSDIQDKMSDYIVNITNHVFDADDEKNCIICYTAEADTCIMDCGHGGLCFFCASEIARKTNRSCPICRGSIKQILRMHPTFFWLRHDVGVFVSDEGYELVTENTVDEESHG